jgi:uncharacterized protein (TIGR02265 family)
MELLVESARLAYPRVPVREGMRRLGQLTYPRAASSTVGKIVFSAVGRNIGAAVRLLPRFYAAFGRKGSVTVSDVTDGGAFVQLRGFWDFPEAYQVGVFEGGITAFGRTGTVRVESLSFCDADFEITWI